MRMDRTLLDEGKGDPFVARKKTCCATANIVSVDGQTRDNHGNKRMLTLIDMVLELIKFCRKDLFLGGNFEGVDVLDFLR